MAFICGVTLGRIWVLLVGLIFPIHCPGPERVPAPQQVPEPIEDMISYPSNEWVLSDMHWLGKFACKEAPCEAGYRSYGFMVFVRKYGRGDQQYVRISAGAERCALVNMATIKGPGYVKLTDDERLQRVAHEVQAQVTALKRGCSAGGLDQPVRTKGLEKLFAEPK